MSFKFLTRRRDRDRDKSSPTRTHSKSTSTVASPASTDASLPSTDSFFRKGKTAQVPSEVQIISWDPDVVQPPSRDVHIRSRADDQNSPTATPVYLAFTTRPSSASLTSKEASTSYSNDALYTGRNHTSGRTFFGARDLPAHRRLDSKNLPRSQSELPHGQDRTLAVDLPDQLASFVLQASDTPKSEHVEALGSPSGANSDIDSKDALKNTLPVRLASKTRRAKSRSEHGHNAPRMTIHGDVDLDDYSAPSFAGKPSSLPPASQPPFSSFHSSASVHSLSSFISLSGAGDTSTHEAETATSSRSSSGFLSRFSSTKRRSRRSKNASAGDARSSASGDSDGQQVGSRPRSASFSSPAPEFLRSRDNAQVPPPSTHGVKPARAAAPPSAWRSDMTTVASMGDIHSTGGAGAATSSAYSSDTEMSMHHASSSGHGAESNDGRTFLQRHLRRGSSGETSVSAANHETHPLHSSLNIFGRIVDSTSKRASTYTAKSGASPAEPLLHLDPASPSVDSPQVTGLPLPLPCPMTASPGANVFTKQLLQRLGPPPVGLPPTSFEERVELIRNHVLNQACPSHPSSSSFSPSLGNDLSNIVLSSSDGTDPFLYRSSQPPSSPCHAIAVSALTATTSSKTIRAAPTYNYATLQDEFDKLECLAEQEMRSLVTKSASSGGPAEQAEALRVLRLEEAFIEARRKCGVDASRIRFELKNVVAGGDESRMEASRSGVLGLGLGLMQHQEEGSGGRGGAMSLTPAPRRRRGTVMTNVRRPITAPEPPAADATVVGGSGRATPPFTSLYERHANETASALQQPTSRTSTPELFTPQSFSSKSTLTAPSTRSSASTTGGRPTSSNDTHSEAGSRSGSSRGSAHRSPSLHGRTLPSATMSASPANASQDTHPTN